MQAISLGIGEPDFVTPCTSARRRSLSRRKTSCTDNLVDSVAPRISTYVENQFNIGYHPKEVLIGVSEALDTRCARS